jgi:Flp pilus assembly protein TadD
MKTIMTVAASLAVMLCGCRGPHPFASTSELAGHKPESDDTSAESAVRPAALTRESRSADNAATNAPVAELLARAEQAIRAEQLVVARSQLQSVLAQQPDQPRAHHLLAVIADQDGRFPEAEQHYFMALAQDPQDSKIVGDLGYSYYLQSRYTESEQYLQRALELDSRNFTAARNLAQLYSDRDEFSRAEHLLRSTLPPSDAETALQQLRPHNARDETALMSSRDAGPAPDELQRQLHNQMYATAGTYPQRGQDQGLRETGLTQAPTPADSFKAVQNDDNGVNPWSRHISSISPGDTHRAAPAGAQDPALQAQSIRDSGALAATGPHAYGSVQQVSEHWNPEDLPMVQPGATSRNTTPLSAASPVAASEPRRWPPATWAPLSDGTPSTDRTSSPPAYATQPDAAAIHQVSGTVNPWNADVMQAVGHGGPATVDHAYYESQDSDHIGREAIQPASLQQPNTPATIPEWGSTPTGLTSRSASGTDPALTGAQYPPPQRDLAGAVSSGPGTGMPVVVPAGTVAPTRRTGAPTTGSVQTYPSRQSYGAATNDTENSYARGPAGAASTPVFEVPAYPYSPADNSTSRVSRVTGGDRPQVAAEEDAPRTGWTQGTPNISAPMTATSSAPPQSSSNVIVPEAYRSGQRPGTTNSTRLSDGYQYRY